MSHRFVEDFRVSKFCARSIIRKRSRYQKPPEQIGTCQAVPSHTGTCFAAFTAFLPHDNPIGRVTSMFDSQGSEVKAEFCQRPLSGRDSDQIPQDPQSTRALECWNFLAAQGPLLQHNSGLLQTARGAACPVVAQGGSTGAVGGRAVQGHSEVGRARAGSRLEREDLGS